MDSVTQFLLGASVAGATLGPKLGARALLIGGVVGTLPDLDSLVSMGNAIDDMTYHRGVTHSLLVQTAVAPIIAYGVAWVVRDARDHWRRLLLTVWLCLTTHALLDSLTTYGTQLFWPLQLGPPVALPAVFIIDPVYSLLLLTGILAFLVWRRQRQRGVAAVRMLLAASTVYLGLGLTAHALVRDRAEAHPAFAGTTVHVQPAPFNILFWQVLGVNGREYVSAITGVPGACPMAALSRHPRLAAPPDGIEPTASVRRLEWFTDGFFSYVNGAGTLRITDLRIGFHPSFIFSFEIARQNDDALEPVEPVLRRPARPRAELIGDLGLLLRGTWQACRS